MTGYSKKPVQKYIRNLERRKKYLDQRVSNSQSDLSYDKAERNALAWVIDVVKQIYPPKPRADDVATEDANLGQQEVSEYTETQN